MKTISVVLTVMVSFHQAANAFQFMSKWKIPTITDRKAEDAMKEQFGNKKLVVVTGTSSGLGRQTAQALLRTGKYHVVGAVRDIDKMQAVAEIDGWPMESFTVMPCELNSFESVRKFCSDLEDWKGAKPIDRLVCNAGVYQPTLPYAKWSADGHEQTMQINFLSHFLMISLLMPDMSRAPDPRIITVGSVTGNDNTVGGGGVYPIADLKDLEGFKAGFKNPIPMADGYGFDGAKAYKDSKLCLMMLANILHAKFNKTYGIAFSSIYPGCIAESPLFREKRDWFRVYFPIFMKYITGGFVGEEEAGQRLFQVAHDPRCSKSGVYWSWNGGPREGRGAEALEKDGQVSGGGGAGGGWDSIFENEQSAKVQNLELSVELFRSATAITGAEWPDITAITSPCPTLKVIGAVSKGMIAKEEMKRMADRPGFDADGNVIQVSKAKKVVAKADKIVGSIWTRTAGRVLRPVKRLASRWILGKIPEDALTGSYQEEKPEEEAGITAVREKEDVRPVSSDADTEEIMSIISEHLVEELSEAKPPVGLSDEELIEEVMSDRRLDSVESDEKLVM